MAGKHKLAAPKTQSAFGLPFAVGSMMRISSGIEQKQIKDYQFSVMAESVDDKYEDVLLRRQLPLSPLPEHLEDRHISLISVLQLDAFFS